jgi:histidine triad (HIT) family protein
MTCAFCTDAATTGEIVYEDQSAWIVVHPDWSVRGHLMVVSKHHVENVSDLAETEWIRLATIWHRTEKLLLALTAADRAIAMKLGIQTPHLHLHLYPFASAAGREEVFDAIDGKRGEERDEAWVRVLRERLREAVRSEPFPGPR